MFTSIHSHMHFIAAAIAALGATCPSLATDCNTALIVPSGQTVSITTDTRCSRFDVQGTLKILQNATLTVCGTGDCTIAAGAGVELGDSSTAGILAFADLNHTVKGGGRIIGKNQNSLINIEGSFKLTSKLIIEGMLTMQPYGGGTAVFENARTAFSEEGVILANTDGLFKFHENLILDDTEHVFLFLHFRPLYRVEGPGTSYGSNKLQFNRLQDGSDATNNPELVGRFEFVNCGTMEFLATVETRGPRSVWTAGRILTNGPGAPVFSYGCPSCVTIDDSASVGGCSP